LAAEFNYTKLEADRQLDITDLVAMLKYRDQIPPIGALFKAFMEAFGSSGNTNNNYQQNNYSNNETDAEFNSNLDGMFGAGVSYVNEMPEWMKERHRKKREE
jgi:hypothetical protein